MALQPDCSPQLEVLPNLAEARGEWTRLAELSGNVFSTWEWASTWWRHFGRGQLRLAGCRTGTGELAAILPLYQTGRRPLRTLRFIGHGPADQLGPIAASSQVGLAARGLGRLLGETEVGWDVFLGDDLFGEADWRSLAGVRTLFRTASPVLHIGGTDWADFLNSRTRSFREQARRQERRLARDYAPCPHCLRSTRRGGVPPVARAHSPVGSQTSTATSRLRRSTTGGCDFTCWSSMSAPRRPYTTSVLQAPNAFTKAAATRATIAGALVSCSNAAPSGTRSTTVSASTGSCAVPNRTSIASPAPMPAWSQRVSRRACLGGPLSRARE
jgi:hypothetical protein